MFDACFLIDVHYLLREVLLGSDFYNKSSKDPAYANLIMPALERSNDNASSEDLTESINPLSSHMSSQLINSEAILSSNNSKKSLNAK